MKTITIRSTLRNLPLAIALGAIALLPLALASCAKSEDTKPDDAGAGHDMSKMPKGMDMPKE